MATVQDSESLKSLPASVKRKIEKRENVSNEVCNGSHLDIPAGPSTKPAQKTQPSFAPPLTNTKPSFMGTAGRTPLESPSSSSGEGSPMTSCGTRTNGESVMIGRSGNTWVKFLGVAFCAPLLVPESHSITRYNLPVCVSNATELLRNGRFLRDAKPCFLG